VLFLSIIKGCLKRLMAQTLTLVPAPNSPAITSLPSKNPNPLSKIVRLINPAYADGSEKDI